MVLVASREGVPPTVKIDGFDKGVDDKGEKAFPNGDKDCYKFVDQMMTLVPNGAPSLVKCKKLTVAGKNISFAAGVVIEGSVKVTNATGEPKEVAAGTYTSDI